MKRRLRWVLLASGILGLRVGVVGFPDWQVAVESAQVVAGIVKYPVDNPFYLYHVTVWTVLHQICAVLLLMGVSEITLSLALSGLAGMVSFQGLSLVVYALSGREWMAIGAAVVVFFSRAAEYGVTYPVLLVGTTHTYGLLGLSMFVLVVALLGTGSYRGGGFLLGFAPAIHPALGSWLWVVVALGMLWDLKRFFEDVRPAAKYFFAGLSLAVISLIVHLLVTYDSPAVDASTSMKYLNAFVEHFDEHRQPVRIFSAGVVFNCAALALALVTLRGRRRELSRSAALMMAIVLASAVLSLGFVALSHVRPGLLPQSLVILMPTRLLNFNTMCFVPLLFGLLGSFRVAPAASPSPAALDFSRARLYRNTLMAILATGLLLSGRSMFWEWFEHRGPEWRSPLGQLLLIGFAAAALLAIEAARFVRSPSNQIEEMSDPASARWRMMAMRGVQGALASVFIVSAVLTWSLRSGFQFRDRTNDPLMAEVAADGTGIVATGGWFHLIQLRTRRPVLLDGGALNTLSYAPKGGPVMDRILRDVYNVDLFNPPPGIPYGTSSLPHEVHKALWEGFSREKWGEIREDYNVTQVLTEAGWNLQLPVAAENDAFKLFRIPPTD